MAAKRKKKPRVSPEAAVAMLDRLVQRHPDAHCELDHRNPFELIVAVVLSAQTTDVAVNKATPALFERYPDAKALAEADPKDVEKLVSTLGFFRNKTKSIMGLAKKLVADHGGEVPKSMAELVKLPGVGRKTANVVLGVAWNTPDGVVVDTHVQRLAQRLGWSRNKEPEKIELDVNSLLPPNRWNQASHTLIFHGRRVCDAQRPKCEECPVSGKDGFAFPCPAAFKAEKVGRKPPRKRKKVAAAKVATKKKTAKKKRRAA